MVEGGLKIMKAHILCFTLKMTSYLFSFSFHHFSHLTILKKKSLADVSKEGKCGVKTARWKETSAAALYTKSATTPVWVFRSSERKRDTGRRVV